MLIERPRFTEDDPVQTCGWTFMNLEAAWFSKKKTKCYRPSLIPHETRLVTDGYEKFEHGRIGQEIRYTTISCRLVFHGSRNIIPLALKS
jgi:hypothetical protein